MRGAPAPLGRGGRPVVPSNEAVGRSYEHPAPWDGWNARGNLANMKPTEAIQLDNIFPAVQAVQLRPGCVDWKTAAPANVHSLLAYSGQGSNKLFASTDAHIYDVTTAGAFGASVQNCTDGHWKSLMISTAGGVFLFALNGADSPLLFDGTTWTNPAITGVTGGVSTLIGPTLHKHRIWAIQKNTTNLYYLGTDSIAGPATLFPVGGIFKKGGVVVAIGTWTLDYGYGVDDRFVIVTSNGEIAVYQGTDPASSATWALIGIFDAAIPVGNRPLLSYGGDLLYLSKVGIIPLSKLAQSALVDRTSSVSYNIDGAFLDAAGLYGNNTGWTMLVHKAASMMLVNIPVTTDALSYQFVMNTTTKAWCRFTGWNASCWEFFNGDIYFGAGLKVCKAWVGSNDSGAPITGYCAQAYASYGSGLQKEVTLVRGNFGFTGSAQLTMSLSADYNIANGQTMFSYASPTAGGIWDLSLWDGTIWDSGVSVFYPQWTTIPNDLGYKHSLILQVNASSGNFVWTSTNMILKGAGPL